MVGLGMDELGMVGLGMDELGMDGLGMDGLGMDGLGMDGEGSSLNFHLHFCTIDPGSHSHEFLMQAQLSTQVKTCFRRFSMTALSGCRPAGSRILWLSSRQSTSFDIHTVFPRFRI